MEIVTVVLVGVIGWLTGALINVLADDLPYRRPPSLPHYPDGTPRRVSAWLAVIAFLTGQRTAPPDRHPPPAEQEIAGAASGGILNPSEMDVIPRPPVRRLYWRHVLVELLTSLAFVALALGFPDEPNLPIWLVYTAIMILITVIDVEHRLILFNVTIPASVLAIVIAFVSPEGDKPTGEFLIGGLVGFALFFAFWLGGVAFTTMSRHNEVAFGFGDVMLALLSGFMIGWRAFIFAALITVFMGALGALVFIVGRMLLGRRHRWFTPLPYGPYIVIGTLIMLYFREDVRELLLR